VTPGNEIKHGNGKNKKHTAADENEKKSFCPSVSQPTSYTTYMQPLLFRDNARVIQKCDVANE